MSTAKAESPAPTGSKNLVARGLSKKLDPRWRLRRAQKDGLFVKREVEVGLELVTEKLKCCAIHIRGCCSLHGLCEAHRM
jgi:hypothetical protein